MTLGRISRIAFLVFSLILLFAVIAGSGSDPANSPTSQLTAKALASQVVDGDQVCSVSSLRGTYAAQAQGTIVGVVLRPTFTGTYAVNTDCTGTTTVNSSLGFVVHDATILVRSGREFRDVQTDSFEVSTRNGVRIGD